MPEVKKLKQHEKKMKGVNKKKDDNYWWKDKKGQMHYHRGPTNLTVTAHTSNSQVPETTSTAQTVESKPNTNFKQAKKGRRRQFNWEQGRLRAKYGPNFREKVYGKDADELDKGEKNQAQRIRGSLKDARRSRFLNRQKQSSIGTQIEHTTDEVKKAALQARLAKSKGVSSKVGRQLKNKRERLEKVTGRSKEERRKALGKDDRVKIYKGDKPSSPPVASGVKPSGSMLGSGNASVEAVGASPVRSKLFDSAKARMMRRRKQRKV